MLRLLPRALALPLALLCAGASSAHDRVDAGVRLLHEELIVLDTHLDTPVLFERPGWNFAGHHEYGWDLSQVDLPRMKAGGLDGGFFVVYTPQGPLTPEGYAAARDAALLRTLAIHRVVAGNPREAELATFAHDAERIAAAGRRIFYLSIENSYPLGEDLGLLETFYKLGVRMAGPVHSRNNQFADSTTDEPRWNGLSPLGRAWVAEMNRLGMVIDASHSSDAAFDQLLSLSKTPIILSHSGPRAIFDHKRNLDDERMRRLAAAGGVMQLNSVFLVMHDTSEERSAIEDRQAAWITTSPADRARLLADKVRLDAQRPYTEANFERFMESLLHAIRVMGVGHVGIGADWDGGGGVQGMEDVADLPRITERLLRAGYDREDVAKIWSGNVLRLLRQAEQHAKDAAAG
jgi:membrane dipeptidase